MLAPPIKKTSPEVENRMNQKIEEQDEQSEPDKSDLEESDKDQGGASNEETKETKKFRPLKDPKGDKLRIIHDENIEHCGNYFDPLLYKKINCKIQ